MDSATKIRENRARRAAARRGLHLAKSRRRDPAATGYGTWTITTPRGRLVHTAPDLAAVEQWLAEGGGQ